MRLSRKFRRWLTAAVLIVPPLGLYGFIADHVYWRPWMLGQAMVPGFCSVSWSPDGETLAIGRGTGVQLWDVAQKRPLRAMRSQFEVYDLHFAPDGKRLAAATSDGAGLWDVQGGAKPRVLGDAYVPLQFSPDGKLLMGAVDAAAKITDSEKVSGSWRGRWDVLLWDARSGRLLRAVPVRVGRHEFAMVKAFSPDLSRVAIGLDPDGEGGNLPPVRLLDARTGRVLHTLPPRCAPTDILLFSGDGLQLVSAGREVNVWDARTGRHLRAMSGKPQMQTLDAVALSSNGTMAGAWPDGTIQLWDVATGQLRRTIQNRQRLDSLAFSPDGAVLAGGARGAAWLWRIQ